MARNFAWRMVAAPVAAAVLAVAPGAGSARADVTVERTMKSGGFRGFGGGDSTMTDKLSGLRKRSVSTMKMTGILGKMAGDLGGDEITDIQKDVVWKLDHKKKTYTESPITPPPQPKEEERGQPERGEKAEKAEKSNVRVVRNEVTVKDLGEKKKIGDFDCAHYQVTWIVETENTETKERSESTMISDLWTTPETAETRALMKEEREFTQAWLKKIGWEMTDEESRKMGLAMVGAMLGGDDESFKKGVKEVAAKMETIKGFPIGTGIKWLVKGSGGAAGKKGGEGGGEGMPDIAKGLGGLMSAFGKKGAKGGGEGAKPGEAAGPTPVFETYTEIRKISVASLPDGDFVPPAGYKKVSP